MNISMNSRLGIVLSVCVVMLLLIGISYDVSVPSLSAEKTEKIPLYFVSTRDPLSTTYEMVTGPVEYSNETYRNNLSK